MESSYWFSGIDSIWYDNILTLEKYRTICEKQVGSESNYGTLSEQVNMFWHKKAGNYFIDKKDCMTFQEKSTNFVLRSAPEIVSKDNWFVCNNHG